MHFCNVCNNMYYIRIDSADTNKLIYYCRNCGNEDSLLYAEGQKKIVSLSKTYVNKHEQQFSHIINKYTKLDPTLPRINNILCPNADCETNTKEKMREIIYIRYDDINMKYIYLCSTCDKVWKTDQEV